jgi:hypothetical protein
MKPPVLPPRTHAQEAWDARQVDDFFCSLVATLNRMIGTEYLRFTQEPREANIMPLSGGYFGGAIAAPHIYIARVGRPNDRLLPAMDLPTLLVPGPVRAVALTASDMIATGISQTPDANNLANLRSALNPLIRSLRLCGFLYDPTIERTALLQGTLDGAAGTLAGSAVDPEP